ncbi:conserved hypothetical protein (plasmid) [Rhodococcus jostii RHA1]|uniref:Uncharacterized protein n=1 Tax=Rhodococcus jostii (strain RHA1) TaxID=101510 RepID=Q0RUY6_RHOJR|nr:conserved hypothetical protein [Rhodococcus jostii RHA1]
MTQIADEHPAGGTRHRPGRAVPCPSRPANRSSIPGGPCSPACAPGSSRARRGPCRHPSPDLGPAGIGQVRGARAPRTPDHRARKSALTPMLGTDTVCVFATNRSPPDSPTGDSRHRVRRGSRGLRDIPDARGETDRRGQRVRGITESAASRVVGGRRLGVAVWVVAGEGAPDLVPGFGWSTRSSPQG